MTTTQPQKNLLKKELYYSTMPCVYNYTSYREFIFHGYHYLKQQNTRFSENALLKKVGFSSSCRGYFSLIISGKRNLSDQSILGFAKAFKLSPKDTDYFESLVRFNQCKHQVERDYYFNKMSSLIKNKTTKSFTLLKSQHDYYTKWYLIDIREFLHLDDFIWDEQWIRQKLNHNVTKKEIKEAIQSLIDLDLVFINLDGKLNVKDPVVKFSDNNLNFKLTQSIQRQFIEMSLLSLKKDNYDERSISSVTLSCRSEDFEKMRSEIKEFREKIINKYCTHQTGIDTVLHLGIQLFHLTTPNLPQKKGANSEKIK